MTDNEEADHKDRDFTNDQLDNLQILTVAKHKTKTSRENTVALKRLVCPVCGNEFFRTPYKVNNKIANGGVPTCSRKCGRMRGGLNGGGTNKIPVSNSTLRLIKKLRDQGNSDYTISPLVGMSRAKVYRTRVEHGID